MTTTKIRSSSQLFVDADLDLGTHKIINGVTPTNATDIATKGYVDGILGTNDAMVYKGVIDCSANPNYPAADAGHTYKVSVAGKIGGASGVSVLAGDLAICTTDATASGTQAAVGAYWDVVHVNAASGTVTSSSGSAVDNAIVRMDLTTGTIVQTSLATIDDSGSINVPTGQSYKVNGTALVSNITHTGDVTDTGGVIAVNKVNGVAFSGLATGILKNTTTTGVPSIAAAGTDYVAPGGALGTPSSGTLTNATGLPISTGVSGLGAGIATFLATPSSANLASVLTDEYGTSRVVFDTNATLTTPTLAGEMFSTSAAVTAGTNAQGQGALTTDYNIITTAAANPSGVTLPTATVGRRIIIVNRGANPIAVFPATGATIDALATNASITIPVNGSIEFNAASATQWFSSSSLQFGATTDMLVGGGTGAFPVWTTSTGTGAPVRASSPTLVTPNLGTPSTLVGTNITGTASGLTSGTVTTNANLTGEVTSVGNAATVTNSAVIAKLLTGYTSGAGTISAADSILSAIQKLNGNDALKEVAANKDASGGYAGLTLFKVNMKNVAGTFTSFLTNTNTTARTYTFPDKDGTVAMTSDISTLVTREAPTGTKNGVNASFTLANTPINGSEHLYLNGILLNQGAGNDYTISGLTITMLVLPVSTDTLLCSYRY